MNIQAIDLVEIGAGGGSIAQARLGVIAVGPESASSTPGPVCYGRGGAEPTVTDADLVLGYINPDYFAGGSIKLQPGAAARAIEERVARPLGPLARGCRVGDPHDRQHQHGAGDARGVDRARPRPARPHAGRLRRLGARSRLPSRAGARRSRAIVLPASAGVTAAIGLLAAEVKFDVARTHVCRLDAVSGAALDAMYDEMSAQALVVVQESAVAGEVMVTRSAEARYVGQGYEVTVPVPAGRLDAAALEGCARVFTRSTPRATATRTRPSRSRWSRGSSRPSAARRASRWPRRRRARRTCVARATRRAYFPEARGYTDTPVYDRYGLAAGRP